MFDLKRHLIREINKSGFDRVIIAFNHELESGDIKYELIGMGYNKGEVIYDSIESFNNIYVFNGILDYLLSNNLFAYFKVVNY